MGGEAGDRTKGRLTSSKDIISCIREASPAECLSSWAFLQTFQLTAVIPNFWRTFVARLGQACKKHWYTPQHRSTSESALITGCFQHVVGHLTSISQSLSSLHTHNKHFKLLHGPEVLNQTATERAGFPGHSGECWCVFQPHSSAITHSPPTTTHTCSPAAVAASSSQKDTKGAWGLAILQTPEWTGRLLVVWRDRDSLLKLHSHPPCSSRVCPNPAVSWGYGAGWRSTRFAPTTARLAQPSPLAVSEAMGRHKPLPTTRNMKHCWSQCVLERVGSHDNSTEAGERALGKPLPSQFWRV